MRVKKENLIFDEIETIK